MGTGDGVSAFGYNSRLESDEDRDRSVQWDFPPGTHVWVISGVHLPTSQWK